VLWTDQAGRAARGSKAFAKKFLQRHAVPTAAYRTFTRANYDPAWLRAQRAPIVIKASGLASGKGVVVAETLDQADTAAQEMLAGRFGDAGDQIVIEEFLQGEEASFIVMADGEHVVPLASAQDHKRLEEADRGPNTGGWAPTRRPGGDAAVHERVMREVIAPTVRGLAADGSPFTVFSTRDS